MRAVISVVTQRFHLTCDAPPLLRIDCCDLHSSCLFCSFVLTQRLLCLALFSSVLLFPVCSVIVVSFIPFIIRLCAFCQVVVVFCFVYYSSCLTHFTPLDLLSLWDRDRLGSCWSTSVIRSRYPFIVFFSFLNWILCTIFRGPLLCRDALVYPLYLLLTSLSFSWVLKTP